MYIHTHVLPIKLANDAIYSGWYTDPIDGSWSDFSEWSECAATPDLLQCLQSRSRTCDNPAPFGEGKDCVGEAEEIRECPMEACGERTMLHFVVHFPHLQYVQ